MSISVVAVLVVIVVAILAVLKAKRPSNVEGLSYESRGPLFSPAERSFFGVLEQALDKQYRVFGKVRLGDIVKPAKGLSNSKRTAALNKLNQKHVDFVVCSVADLAVVGVVELDDQSHGREDRTRRDVFVNQALAGASIPVARFSAKRGYSITETGTMLVEVFKLGVGAAEPQVSTAASSPAPTPASNIPEASPGQGIEKAPVCPKCAATMVKRQAKNGPHVGQLFWACSTYPKCRQVLPTD